MRDHIPKNRHKDSQEDCSLSHSLPIYRTILGTILWKSKPWDSLSIWESLAYMPQMIVIGSRSFKRVGFILIGLLRKRAKPNDSYVASTGNGKPRLLCSPSPFLTNIHSWHLFVEWFQGTMQFKFLCNFQQIRKSGIDIVENTCFITEFKYIYQMHPLKIGVLFFWMCPIWNI